MDPEKQPQFNPNTPISEVLKQEQTGFVPSAQVVPKVSLTDAVGALENITAVRGNDGLVKPLPNVTPTEPAQTNTTGTSVTIPNAPATPPPPVSPIRMIKTYRSDAAAAVKTQYPSVAKIAIAEEVQRRARGEFVEETSHKRKFGLLLLAIGFITLGAIAIPTVQYILNQKKAAVPVAAEKTIIPFDHQENAMLNKATRDELLAELNILGAKQSVASTIEYRKIWERVEGTDGSTTTQKIAPDVFASLIGPNMLPALARSFDSDYMYGVENSDSSKSFILFKTSSYQQTFANMLRWEEKMILDLKPVLNINIDALGQSFTDQVVINKDVRAVSTSDGTILFLYGFLDDQTLVLTTNAQTFQDINSRYVGSHFVQ